MARQEIRNPPMSPIFGDLAADHLCHSEPSGPERKLITTPLGGNLEMSIAPHIPAELESKKGLSKSVPADQIGQHLRNLYDNVLRQPVPGRFRELLRELEGPSGTLPVHLESFE